MQENTPPETCPDELLPAIADERRRQILRVLLETGRAVSLDGLVTEIVRRAPTGEMSTAPKRIKAMLYHSHIPMLADAGLVAYVASDESMQLVYTGSPESTAFLSDVFAAEER
ncbi:MAG: DUF7344 domain-containing protein [Halovenus sp.]